MWETLRFLRPITDVRCAPAVQAKDEGGEDMIRAVRHFLWYLEHHSTGGRDTSRPRRTAEGVLGGPPNTPKDRESAVLNVRRRQRADEHGPAES